MTEPYSYDRHGTDSTDGHEQPPAQPDAGGLPPHSAGADAAHQPDSGAVAQQPETGASRSPREYGLPASADAHAQAGAHPSANAHPSADTHTSTDEASAPFTPANPPKPAPGTDVSTDLGAALNFVYRSVMASPRAFIVPGVIYFVVILGLTMSAVIIGFVVFFSSIDAWTATGSDDIPLRPLLILYAIIFGGALLAMPFSLLWSTGAAAAGDKIVEGTKPSIRDGLLAPGRVILTALLVGLITTIGMLLCYLPGLVASAFLIFAVPAAARGASPVAAVKESIALVKSNLGTALLTWLVVQVIASVGGSLVITLVIAIPAAYLFEVAMFERMNGRELPDPRAEEQPQAPR